MDIQVRFEDGAVEMIARNAPCVPYGPGGPFDHIKPGTEGFVYSTTPAHKAQGPTWHQRAWFRHGDDWRVGRMESTEEQIERLSKTVGAEKARANAAEKRLADLRAWAVPMIPHYDMMDQVVARIDGKAQ